MSTVLNPHNRLPLIGCTRSTLEYTHAFLPIGLYLGCRSVGITTTIELQV